MSQKPKITCECGMSITSTYHKIHLRGAPHRISLRNKIIGEYCKRKGYEFTPEPLIRVAKQKPKKTKEITIDWMND